MVCYGSGGYNYGSSGYVWVWDRSPPLRFPCPAVYYNFRIGSSLRSSNLSVLTQMTIRNSIQVTGYLRQVEVMVSIRLWDDRSVVSSIYNPRYRSLAFVSRWTSPGMRAIQSQIQGSSSVLTSQLFCHATQHSKLKH